MTVVFDRSKIPITGMGGILVAAAVGLTLPQVLRVGKNSLVLADQPGFQGVLDPVIGANLHVKAVQEDLGGTNPGLAEGPFLPIGRAAVLGHYPSYGAHHLPVENIRYDILTHVSYFSLMPLTNGDLDASELDVAQLEELVARADANGVKTIVTVGGWGRSTYFPDMAASPRARDDFAASLLLYCLEHNLHGADLDWEPVRTLRDRTNYSLLVERVHEEFEPFGLSLSVSVNAYGHEIKPEAIEFVDSLNVMAYDATPPDHSTFDFAASALQHWEDYGAPREKLMLGLPFYGRTKDGAGYAYYEIVEAYHPDPNTDSVAGIGFNGIHTIKHKTEYVVNNGYAGVMIWEITQDTSDESSLLAAVGDAIASLPPATPDPNAPADVDDLQVLGSVSSPGVQTKQWSDNDQP